MRLVYCSRYKDIFEAKKQTRKKIFQLIAVFMYTIYLQKCLNTNNIYCVYIQGLFQDFKTLYIYIYIYIFVNLMVFTTEGFFEVAIESWPECVKFE